jgi:hypothetical protein
MKKELGNGTINSNFWQEMTTIQMVKIIQNSKNKNKCLPALI